MSVAQESRLDRSGVIACPFCASKDNELFSLFGQSLLSSQYYCRHCRSVFEGVRWEGPIPGEAEAGQTSRTGRSGRTGQVGRATVQEEESS